MSYYINMDGNIFCSSEAERSTVINPVVELEINHAGTLSFTMLPDHPLYNSIVMRQSLFDVYLNGELIFEGVPISEQTDFWNRKTVDCEGDLTFLNDTIQRQAVYQNQTVTSLLTAYLNEHNAQCDAAHQFQLGNVTVNGGSSIYRFTNYQNTLTEINEDLIGNFGGMLQVRHVGGVRYLDYLDASPRVSTQTIYIGVNLLDFSQTLTSADVCTVLIPLGARTGSQLIEGLDERVNIKSVNSDLDYLVGTAASTYGKVWKTVTWDDVSTPAALKTKGQDYLDNAQYNNLVLEATALDLGLSDAAVQQFRLLDSINVVSEPHNLNKRFLLTKLKIDLDHPADTTITLGDENVLSISARTSQLATDAEFDRIYASVQASSNAREILEAATGGNVYFVYDSNGVCTEIRILDTADPNTATRIWRWNINGWGYSDDGGQTYSLAATMNGTIYADFIKAGVLSSPNGKYSLDMVTGSVNMANANITGGEINIQSDSATNDIIRLQHTNNLLALSPYQIIVADETNPSLNSYIRSSDYVIRKIDDVLLDTWDLAILDRNGLTFKSDTAGNPVTAVYPADIHDLNGFIQVATYTTTTNNYGNIILSESPNDVLVVAAYATLSNTVNGFCQIATFQGNYVVHIVDRSGASQNNTGTTLKVFYIAGVSGV